MIFKARGAPPTNKNKPQGSAMDYKPTMHIVNFSDKIRALNQLRTPDLRLTAVEANNLHADITTMLAEIARLNLQLQNNYNQTIEVQLDGGKF